MKKTFFYKKGGVINGVIGGALGSFGAASGGGSFGGKSGSSVLTDSKGYDSPLDNSALLSPRSPRSPLDASGMLDQSVAPGDEGDVSMNLDEESYDSFDLGVGSSPHPHHGGGHRGSGRRGGSRGYGSGGRDRGGASQHLSPQQQQQQHQHQHQQAYHHSDGGAASGGGGAPGQQAAFADGGGGGGVQGPGSGGGSGQPGSSPQEEQQVWIWRGDRWELAQPGEVHLGAGGSAPNIPSLDLGGALSAAGFGSFGGGGGGDGGGAGGGSLVVRALADYVGTDDNELSLQEGQEIVVLRKDDSGWWEGEVNGVVGWFPSNYVHEKFELWPITEVDTPLSTARSGLGTARTPSSSRRKFDWDSWSASRMGGRHQTKRHNSLVPNDTS